MQIATEISWNIVFVKCVCFCKFGSHNDMEKLFAFSDCYLIEMKEKNTFYCPTFAGTVFSHEKNI
jgi:hypothetical protein